MKRTDILTWRDTYLDDDYDPSRLLYACGTRKMLNEGRARQVIALDFAACWIAAGECGPMLVRSKVPTAPVRLVVASVQHRWRGDPNRPLWVVDSVTSGQVVMPWAQYLEVRKQIVADRKRHQKQRDEVRQQREDLKVKIIEQMGLPPGTRLANVRRWSGSESGWVTGLELALDPGATRAFIAGLSGSRQAKVQKLLAEHNAIEDPTC